ncbi:MAG: histidine phosphatase family protein [Zavarzinella sp.]
MISTRIFLVRHAETTRPDLIHGAESDVNISVNGWQHALRLGQYLQGHTPHVIATSAMTRAIRTAIAINQYCNTEIFVQPRFHERKVGRFSQTSVHERPFDMDNTFQDWQQGNLHSCIEGTESFLDMQARVIPAFEDFVHRFQNKTLVMVSHGIVIRMMLHHYQLLPPETVWTTVGRIHNLAVTELMWDRNGPTLVRWNDRQPVHGN